MSKTLRLLALCFGIVGVAVVCHARLTGTNPTGSSADAWCVGKTAAESCVDSAGDVIPTTTATQTLGTASLVWSNIFLSAGAIDTAKIGIAAIDTTKLAADAVTNSKLISGAVDTRVLASDSVTNSKIITGAVDTRTIAPASIDTSKIAKVSAGSGALCEMNNGTGKFGHCTAASAVTCTCQ